MQKTLTFRHTAVAYEDIGNGDVVILIHGFGEDGTVWKHQVALLQEQYRVIIPDLPGSGLSPLPDGHVLLGGEAFSIETFAELTHALLRHERIEQCCLIGHSMGGYITLAFAEKYPEYLKGWGLFHSTALADNPEKQQARRKGMTFIRENGAQAFLKLSVPNLFADRFKQEQPREVADLIERGALCNPSALISYYEAMLERPDRSAILQNSPVPVLMIIGEQDLAVPLQDSLKQASMAATSFVQILEQVAHMGMWEAAVKTSYALLDFLSFTYRT